MRENDQYPNTLEIPRNANAISPDWITRAFISSGILKHTKVVSTEIQPLGPGAGYMGQLFRLQLSYSDQSETAPESVVVKMSHIDPVIRANLHKSGVYETEINFYREFASDIHLPIPNYYYGDVNHKTGSSILLLEDLGHFKGIDFPTGCNLPESELVVEHLAKFHANWWESFRLLTSPYLTSHGYGALNSQKQFQKWWPQLPEKLDALLPGYRMTSAFIELGHLFSDNVARIFDKMSEKPVTFVHKDTHSNNLLFDSSGIKQKVKFLDWQTAGYGRGVADVAYFMVSSTPISLRQQEENRILQTYYRLLLDNGVQGYSFEQCWSDYQLAYYKNLFVIGVLVNVLDISNPEGKLLLKALLPRVMAFSEDHNVKSFL